MKLCKPEKWRVVMSMTLAYYLRKPKQSTSLERFCSGEVLFCYIRFLFAKKVFVKLEDIEIFLCCAIDFPKIKRQGWLISDIQKIGYIVIKVAGAFHKYRLILLNFIDAAPRIKKSLL